MKSLLHVVPNAINLEHNFVFLSYFRNNSYNYDPNITSGSESMDNFIDDDIQYRSRKKKVRFSFSVFTIYSNIFLTLSLI